MSIEENKKIVKSGRTGKVDLKYLAKVAGVAPSTVSRALSNDAKTSKKTIEKIQKLAREMNYYPDSLAKGLREKKTNTIGIILNDLNNPFYTEVLSSIGEALYERNYSMIVNYSKYEARNEKSCILSMLSKRVDGIIISPIGDKSENIEFLIDNNINAVIIDCFPKYNNISYVYTDHGKGAELATEYLIQNGHKEILLFIGPLETETSLARQFRDSFFKTLKKHKIKYREDLILRAEEFSMDGGYNAFKNLLTVNDQNVSLNFTGIVTCGDLLAIGVYSVANELRFEIPTNYSIIGYDNIKVTSALSPPLTTIHQPRK
ncbi:MAG: LacI family transcriptional regulator, partial [Actinobacteria bacterium]|nr:LacI family transcriptional regulator [Actinomycetota bacterium]